MGQRLLLFISIMLLFAFNTNANADLAGAAYG